MVGLTDYRSQSACVWFGLVSIRLMMAFCECDVSPVNFTVGCILHPSWWRHLQEQDQQLHNRKCSVNISLTASVLDTDNQFLLSQKVSWYKMSDSSPDLILIGPSPVMCSSRHIEEEGDDAIFVLPCPSGPIHKPAGSMMTSWLSKMSSPVWNFLTKFIESVPQNTIVVIYEESTGRYIGEYLDTTLPRGREVQLMMFSVRDLLAEDKREKLFRYLHALLYVKGIYGILLGPQDRLTPLLRELNEFDQLRPRTTDFRHRSFWIVLTHLERAESLLDASRDLENIAVLSPGLSLYGDLKQPVTNTLLDAMVDALDASCHQECVNMTQQDIRRLITAHLQSKFQTDEFTHLYVFVGEGLGESRHFTRHQVPGDSTDLLSLLYPNTKYGYNGRLINVTIQPWPGFMERVRRGNRTEYQGMCIEILHVLQEALNFTYTLYENRDKTWGVEVNGSWIGMVGELHRREADLALADVTIHYQRDEVVDFVLPAFKTEVTDIVYRKWESEEFDFHTLTRPFQPLVVLCVASTLVLFTLLIVITETLNPYNRKLQGSYLPFARAWETAWYLLGSVLMQGGSQEPRSCTGRVLMSTWWVFCIVVGATYSATLIVSFAVQEEDLPFTSLAELVDNPDFTWGMFDGSIAMLFLTNSTRPDFRKAIAGVRRFVESDPEVLSTDIRVQLRKVQTERYALISSRNTLEYMQAVSKPQGMDLRILGEGLYSTHVALAVPTHSTLVPDLERVMATVSESGLLKTWEEQWWNQTYRQVPSLTLGGKPITLRNFLNALCLVAIGTAIALFALCMEHLYHRFRSRTRTLNETRQTSTHQS